MLLLYYGSISVICISRVSDEYDEPMHGNTAGVCFFFFFLSSQIIQFIPMNYLLFLVLSTVWYLDCQKASNPAALHTN